MNTIKSMVHFHFEKYIHRYFCENCEDSFPIYNDTQIFHSKLKLAAWNSIFQLNNNRNNFVDILV